MRLKVGQRLILIVVLCSLPAAVAAYFRWSDSRAQLTNSMERRLKRAQSGFGAEIEQNQSCAILAARAGARTLDISEALKHQRPGAAREAVVRMGSVYTDTLIVLATDDGHVIASSEPARIPATLAIPELAPLSKGQEVMTFAPLTIGVTAGYSLIAAAPVVADENDAVIGRLAFITPLDADYLEGIEKKLNANLAVTADDKLVAACSDHPDPTLEAHGGGAVTITRNGKIYSVATFLPPQLALAGHEIEVSASTDVTEMIASNMRSLNVNLAWIAGALVLGLLLAWQIASRMTGAIKKIGAAAARVHDSELLPVEGVNTGDELEDLATQFNEMVAGLKDGERVKATFGKYVARQVLEVILSRNPELGQGETIPVTVLFSDIRGFTSISEHMDPKDLLAFLNTYFTGMVDSVYRHNGAVDKFIGDAIMAVFGAPVPTPDDALNAVRAAIEMKSKLKRLNEDYKARGLPEIKIGIGIHTGRVVAGNMGHADHMQYTVIGDAVNLASRLESMTKEMGVDILLSEETYLAIKPHIDAEPLRKILVKGRAQEVMVYRLVGLTGEMSSVKAP